MCDTIDVENFRIEIDLKNLPRRVLAFATIQMAEMRIKGFVIAEGPDRDTGEINLYVQPPSSGKRFGHQRVYFWLEDQEKWQRLEELILAEYQNRIRPGEQAERLVDPNVEAWRRHQEEVHGRNQTAREEDQ